MVKKILNIFLVALSVVGIFMTGLYVYYSATDNELYTNSTSTYATSVTDPSTGEKMPPFEINYYANYNNTGKEVIEFRIRGYSDQNKSALYCRGYQLVDGTLYYADSFNGHSWPSMHVYDEKNDEGQQKTFYYIDIDKDVYAVRLDGTYTVNYKRVNYGKQFLNGIIRCCTVGISRGIDYYDYYSETHFYTYKDLLIKMAAMVKGSSYGTGKYTMPLIDLGDYLHVYNCSDVGKADAKPIGEGGLINSYFAIDINFDKRGMTYAEQSIYGSVAGDAEFNITGIDFNVNYWKATQIYNLTENNFVERYSSVDGGYYYALSNKTISELKKYENLEVNVNFDISKIKNKNVLGLDNYSLYGLTIKNIKITNNRDCDFKLLLGSLKDTGIETITTHNVNIQNYSGLEVQYEVV